jgi:hypothetical protein
VVGPSVGRMLTSVREEPRVVDEVAGHVERVCADLLAREHEVGQVAWWRALRPSGEQPAEQPSPVGIARGCEHPEPVNAGRSTTWSRWA